MKERFGWLSEEQTEEHRLEIENRIRNLFWTISGDYSLDVKPDVKAFRRSRSAALYDALKQGAFVRYFDSEKLTLYLMKKMYLSAPEGPLMELARLCVDAAVYPKAAKERPGTADIRRRAFEDLLGEEEPVLNQSFFEQVKIFMMKNYLGRKPLATSDAVRQAAEEIASLEHAGKTEDIIEKMEMIYNSIFDRKFEETHGNLETVQNLPPLALASAMWQECLTDEQMEEIIQKYLSGLGKDMMSLHIKEERPRKRMRLTGSEPEEEEDSEMTDPASVQKVQEYVALNYGKNYLSALEQERRRNRLCTGMHAHCFLHDTDGILHDPVMVNNQYRFWQLQFEKNKLYYYSNSRIIKRNIQTLTDTLKKALVLRSQEDICRAVSGQLAPARLWKLGRTEDEKLFDKRKISDSSGFVVDLLLDSSGSQAVRQSQAAVQGYIISEALSAAGIPHKVVSYCTFWNHTIFHRFRDYDDDRTKNERIFEFRASGDNRDGLAIRATYDSLLERPETHKILILLSDGKPCDVSIRRPGMKSPADYTGEAAVKDTAFEVRRARALGISVLGIFAGNYEDTSAEKRIFGKDFAYIRDIRDFSHIAGVCLRRQLEEE